MMTKGQRVRFVVEVVLATAAAVATLMAVLALTAGCSTSAEGLGAGSQDQPDALGGARDAGAGETPGPAPDAPPAPADAAPVAPSPDAAPEVARPPADPLVKDGWPTTGCNPETGEGACSGNSPHCDWMCNPGEAGFSGVGGGRCSNPASQACEGMPCGVITSDRGNGGWWTCRPGSTCYMPPGPLNKRAYRHDYLDLPGGQFVYGTGICRRYCHGDAGCPGGKRCVATDLPCHKFITGYQMPPGDLPDVGLCEPVEDGQVTGHCR